MKNSATDMPLTNAKACLTYLTGLKANNEMAAYESAVDSAWINFPDSFEIALEYFRHLKGTQQFEKAVSLLKPKVESPDATAIDFASYADILIKMGFLDDAWDIIQQAKARKLEFKPLKLLEVAHAQYVQGLDEAGVYQILKNYGASLSDLSSADRLPPPVINRSENRSIRVGIYSPHFIHHPTAIFAFSSFNAENADEFEWFFYHDTPEPDNEMTKANRTRSHHWRPIRQMTELQAAQQIRDDQIDILIDLCGFLSPGRHEIMALRPAPIQISWQGWPGTSGLNEHDWRLTDAVADPRGDADKYSTEKVYRLPNGHHCYVSPFEYPTVSMPPILQNGYVTFGSANNLIKYTPEVLQTWAAILNRLPNSRLRLRRDTFGDPYCRAKHIERFKDHGLPVERIDLMPFAPVKKVNDHLNFYNLIDIALDPFPYNGMTTTAEPLLMGVPVVALRGQRHSARVSASMISRVGLEDWVGDTTDEYIDIACRKGSDLAHLFDLRESLRSTFFKSPLGNEAIFQEDMKAALRFIWKDSLSDQ